MRIRTWAAGAAALALGGLALAVAAPAQAQESELPDLAIFGGEGSGQIGDVARIGVTVSNQGTAPPSR